MIIIAFLAAIISILSPFWGLIFILAYGNKYKKYWKSFYLIFAAGLIIFFLLGSIGLIRLVIDLISLVDIVFGVGLSSLLYLYVLNRTYDYFISIQAVFMLNVSYSLLKFFTFGKQYVLVFQEAIAQSKDLLTANIQSNQEQLLLAVELIEKIGDLFAKYYVSIWVATSVIAVYIASLLLSRKSKIVWQYKISRLPFPIIYILIISLGMVLFNQSRLIGQNLIIMLIPLFLIQGSSIIDFYWGEYFKKSRFLLVLLIISIVLNYYIMLLITLIGLVDVWFDIRKIETMED